MNRCSSVNICKEKILPHYDLQGNVSCENFVSSGTKLTWRNIHIVD
jgi:hypothetical protein